MRMLLLFHLYNSEGQVKKSVLEKFEGEVNSVPERMKEVRKAHKVNDSDYVILHQIAPLNPQGLF